MEVVNIILTIILVISCLVLIGMVLLQSSKSSGLGSIMGGSETFFGKNKSKSKEGRYVLITKISAAFLLVLSALLTIFQGLS